jgi:hypothetical protein
MDDAEKASLEQRIKTLEDRVRTLERRVLKERGKSQEFDLQAFQKDVETELHNLIAEGSAERSDGYTLSKTLQRLLENASDPQSDQDLLRRLLEMEPGQQALRQDEAKKDAIDFSQISEHTSLHPAGRRTHISEQAAKAILQRKAILVYLCPALESAGHDAFEIAKIITPILSGLVIAGTISIPLVPVLFASMALVISRSGRVSLCAEYAKKDKKDTK